MKEKILTVLLMGLFLAAAGFFSSGVYPNTFTLPATKECHIVSVPAPSGFGTCFGDDFMSGIRIVYNGPFVNTYIQCRRFRIICEDMIDLEPSNDGIIELELPEQR